LVEDIGHSVTNRTCRGTLKLASPARQCAMTSSSASAAPVSAVAGQYLQSRGAPGLDVTALQNGIPQVLEIIVIGRLAAALILS
jgi:hypothetical protein